MKKFWLQFWTLAGLNFVDAYCTINYDIDEETNPLLRYLISSFGPNSIYVVKSISLLVLVILVTVNKDRLTFLSKLLPLMKFTNIIYAMIVIWHLLHL